METNPIVPRQRNRRADRQATAPVEEQAVQSAPAVPVVPVAPVQQLPPVQIAAPVRQVYQQAPVQPAPMQPTPPARQMYQQIPQQQPYPQGQRTAYPPAYPQPMPAQPVRPAPQSYPPVQGGYQQRPQQMQQPMPPAQSVQYAPRARSVNQPAWQPVVRQPVEVPHARASRSLNRETAREAKAAQREAKAQAIKEARERAQWQAEKAEWEAEKARRAKEKKKADPEQKKKQKLPGWLTTALSLSVIGVMALVAAYYLMQAYLVTQENERIAAYEAILDNYHVTESADGTLRVTWQDAIEKYAAEYNLQPAFVTAIIRNESSFRTGAESSVGARGLMQLMPDTAEWIAGKLDDYSYTFDSMWDAETNIRYGCWYLGYLSRLFHGDAMLVSAAYHAGQTSVTQWLSDPAKSADGVSLNLDALADGPTKQYIGRVTQTYGIYQSLLYPDQAFGTADDVPAGNSGFGITIER